MLLETDEQHCGGRSWAEHQEAALAATAATGGSGVWARFFKALGPDYHPVPFTREGPARVRMLRVLAQAAPPGCAALPPNWQDTLDRAEREALEEVAADDNALLAVARCVVLCDFAKGLD